MNALLTAFYAAVALAGALAFLLTRRTPRRAYVAFRRLYALTDGRSNDLAAAVLSRLRPPAPAARAAGVLGELDAARVAAVCAQLERDGFFVFEERLAPAACERLRRFALESAAEPMPAPPGCAPRLVYDPQAPVAPKYRFDEPLLLEQPDVQALLTDASLLALARAYLRVEPICDLVTAWWSTAVSKGPSSEAGQLYHYDMDRIRFLKLFVYLTDVGPGNGPHCFVRGSHRGQPAAIRREGRIPEGELESVYPPDAIVEIGGPAGTLFAADTRGFHKGKPLERGDRLVLQLEFAVSLFGAPYEPIRLGERHAAGFRREVRRQPRVFSRFR